jgi:rare lipoprotein A
VCRDKFIAGVLRALLIGVAAASLAGCGTVGRVKTALTAEDGPPEDAPASYASIPDAVPVDEPPHPTANRRATGQGRYFVNDVDLGPFSQRGWATWYGRKYAGRSTLSGDRFDPLAMMAAHPRLPIPSYARVTSTRTGKSVIVRINDRGPAESAGVIALSYAAAAKLGIATPEGGEVDIVRLTADDIAKLNRTPQPKAQAQVPASRPAAPVVQPVTAPPAPAPVPAAAPRPAPPPPVAAAPAVAASGAASAAAATPDVLAMPSPWSVPAGGAARAQQQAPVAAAPEAAPAAPRAAPAATRKPAPAKPAPTQASGRWSVQVGVFAVAETADSVRRAVADKLAAGAADLPEAERTPRVELRGARHLVLVGDSADRAEIDALAERVKATLRQDVVVLRR